MIQSAKPSALVVTPAVGNMAARGETAAAPTSRLNRPVSRLVTLVRLSAAFLAICMAPELFAGSASAPMSVSVTVIARAVLTIVSEPAAITVTETDIARGYVDVTAPIVVRVRTNSRTGYLLQADKQTADFGTVELAFGDATLTVADGESWIGRPYVPGGDVIAMYARLRCGSGMQAGSYPLPVALSAQPR